MSETQFKVKLDTKQAKGQLRSFTKDAARGAAAISGKLRSAVGRGMSMVGVGAAIGTGVAAVRGAASSGIGDVVGEYSGYLGSQMGEAVFGDQDNQARASKSAREETMQAFALVAGAQGAVPQGAVDFYNGIRAIREQQEKGRDIIAQDSRFYSPGVQNMADGVVGQIGQHIAQGFEWLSNQISGTKG